MSKFKKGDLIQLDKYQTSYYWKIMLAYDNQNSWNTGCYWLDKHGDCKTIGVSNSETNVKVSED